jgi:uncharacterized protein (DUF58 family)
MFFRTNRIYIMPSLRGVAFLICIAVMVVIGATYNNNLIFLLSFSMFSVFVVCMLQTHYMLKGVRLAFRSAEEAFQDDPLRVNLQLTKARLKPKHQLQIRSTSKQFITLEGNIFSMAAEEKATLVTISLFAWRRGVHALPTLIVESFYPLGLFRAWKMFKFPEARVVVYPRPEMTSPLAPEPQAQGEDPQGVRASPEGDFGELREYIQGESYRQIAWKKFSKSGDLYTKVHWGQEHRHYRIPWMAHGRDPEQRLRWMSGWIKKAVDENASFEMQTDNDVIESGSGIDHARRCWMTLAEIPHRRPA